MSRISAPMFALLLALPGLVRAEPGAGPAVSQPHVKARLLIGQSHVRPGDRVPLAVEMEIDKQWHVYWRDSGEGAGLPTQLAFKLPAGWSAAPWQYPFPTAHWEEDLESTAYIHEGTIYFLTELTVPVGAKPDTTEKIAVEASWLVCKQECIRGEASLKIDLPIVAPKTKIQSANDDAFDKARRKLPVAASEAKYLKLRVSGAPAQLPKVGDRIELKVHVDLDAGHHIQSTKPIAEGLIATQLFLDPPDGVVVAEPPRFPPAKERRDPLLGKLSEFSGSFEIAVPLEVQEVPAGTTTLHGVLRYQACNEKGTCFPPIATWFEVPLGPAAPRAEVESDRPALATEGVTPPGAKGGPAAGGAKPIVDRIVDWLAERGFVGYLLMAFLGGLLMNVMPCVLPVISIKVLSFVRQAHEERFRIFLLGLTYSAGIMVFYLGLAILFYKTGQGWGQQFQNPRVVLGVAGIVFAFALSLFGVFSLFAPRIVNRLGEKAEGEGLGSAFATGLLATLMGTACTAPLLSPAIAYAGQLGPTRGPWLFVAVGLGMALPFLALSANPSWLRFVPRPGPWMGKFEALMGFALMATVLWIINPLPGQIGDVGLRLALIFLLFVGAAAWLKGQMAYDVSFAQRLMQYTALAAVVVVGWLIPFRWLNSIDALSQSRIEQVTLIADGHDLRELKASGETPHGEVRRRALDWSKGIPWQHYRRSKALDDVRAGYTVFVDYTADWCVNCKVNKKAVLERDEVVRQLREMNVVPYEADYTVEIPEIKEDLKKYGRAGVPMYLVYPAGKPEQARVLPELLTVGIVLDALREAGPSAPAVAGK